jgi:hypothetical protein
LGFLSAVEAEHIFDQQHIMALPYVDLFITDDQQLAGLMKRVANNFPFKSAEIVGKADFDARYP